MAPITTEAIGQMREILSGIVLKKLRHNQAFWHCGTAHCVAGWNTVLNHAELYEKERRKANGDIWGIRGPGGYWTGDALVARKDWGLSKAESDFLFAGEARLIDQISLVEYLADGKRWMRRTLKHPVPDLKAYRERYSNKTKRTAWARQFEQPRPNCEIVADLLTQSSGKKIVEQIVEVEYATSDQNNGYR